MRTRVGMWGDSLAVRIPELYAKELDLDDGAEVDVTRVDGGLLLRPRKPAYTLDGLLAQVKPQNLHGETDWGPAAGREAW